MVLYSKRTNQQIVLIRPGTIADVEKLENRKPDQEDIERTELGYRAVGQIKGEPSLLLFDLAYVNATNGSTEVYEAFRFLGCKGAGVNEPVEHYSLLLQAGNSKHEMIICLLGAEVHTGEEIIKTEDGFMGGRATHNLTLYAKMPVSTEHVKMFADTMNGADNYLRLIDHQQKRVTMFNSFTADNVQTDSTGGRIYKGQSVFVILLEGCFATIELKELIVVN